MKSWFLRIIGALLCLVMIVSSFTSCILTEKQTSDAGREIDGGKNVYLDDDDLSAVTEKYVLPVEEIPEETLSVSVDPFIEEQFLQVIDQNDDISTVRRVADDGEKVIYNISVNPNGSSDGCEEKIKEDISNTIGAIDVSHADDLVIPEADLAKTYKGEIKDAEGNLLVPYDVAYPASLDDESVVYNKSQILIKFVDNFDGGITRELKLCGVTGLTKFLSTDKGVWYKAKLADGMNTVSALKKARSITIVRVAELDYEYEPDSSLNSNNETYTFGTDGDWEYMSSEDSVLIIKYTGKNNIVEIPSVINGLPVVEITTKYNAGLSSDTSDKTAGFGRCTSVIIPGSVKKIATAAFMGSALTEIALPSGIEQVEAYAFCNCDKATVLSLPDTLVSIGTSAFENCSKIGSVVIPDSVVSVGADAFKNCTSIVNAVIGSGLDYNVNGRQLFYGCTGIKTAEIKCENIPMLAFNKCYNLETVVLSSNVKHISDGAFSYCEKLVTINLPDGITVLEHDTFFDCRMLADITIPGTVTEIRNNAFQYCRALTALTVPEGVKRIGEGVFLNCSSLKEVYLPESLVYIGPNNASALLETAIETVYYNGTREQWDMIESLTDFKNITIVFNEPVFNASDWIYDVTDGKVYIKKYLGTDTNVFIPYEIDGKIVTEINICGFAESSAETVSIPGGVEAVWRDLTVSGSASLGNKLKNINVSIRNEYYSSEDGVLFDKKHEKLVAFPPKNASEYVIPGTVTEIMAHAFIGSDIVNVTIPDSVHSIGYGAFSSCAGLEQLTVPDSVSSLGAYVCENCTDLQRVVLGNGISEIPEGAFKNCTSLNAIILPVTLKTVRTGAFNGCSSLVVYSNGSEEMWNEIVIESQNDELISAGKAFVADPSITSGDWIYKVKNGNAVITAYIGSDTDVAVPGTLDGRTVTEMNDYCMAGSGIVSITMPDSIKHIGYGAFRNSSYLTTVTFGSGIEEIEEYAFDNCHNLSSVYISDLAKWCGCGGLGLHDAGLGADFYLNGEMIVDLVIPSGVTKLSWQAFAYCASIRSIVIPDSVTSIDGYAVEYCRRLESVVIGDGVELIDFCAFSTNPSLKTVEFGSDVKVIGAYSFHVDSFAASYAPSNIESVRIPAGLTDVRICAFMGVNSIDTVYYGGTREQWNEINIEYGNDVLKRANLVFEGEAGYEAALENNPKTSDQWYLDSCGIKEAWAYLEGKGMPAGGTSNVVVAVIDTGVDYTHPDLKANMWINGGEIPGNGIDDDGNGYVDDFYGINAVTNSGDPMDNNGHGTHVAGIIGASNNKEGILGIAYNTKIMAVKAANDDGTFSQSDIAKAINYAFAMGADVINMSFAGTATSIAVQDALTSAYTRSVLVASAGNDSQSNDQKPYYPAALTYVIGVMSVDENGFCSSFNNYDGTAHSNYEYDVYASGERMLSTYPGGKYLTLNGTSMAAPVVSAIAALLRSYYADLDMYPARFIAAQLCETGETSAVCVYSHAHHDPIEMITDAYAALTKLPKPEVHILDHYVTDNNDGYVDAGDTLDIGFTLRNYWGMSSNTTLTIDARTYTVDPLSGEITYGALNPYIEILNGSANIGSIGTYNTKTMLTYNNDQTVSGINNPIKVKIADNCPNDCSISVRVLLTYNNGLDENDQTIYTNGDFGDEFFITVRKGVVKTGRITADETWTKDKYYIIAGSLYINEGVTVTVEEGTTVQFYGNKTDDVYGENKDAMIYSAGKFITSGTADEPVKFVLSESYSNKNINVQSVDHGIVRLAYTIIDNALLKIDRADHCNILIGSGDFSIGTAECSYISSSSKTTIRGIYNKCMLSNVSFDYIGSVESCVLVSSGYRMYTDISDNIGFWELGSGSQITESRYFDFGMGWYGCQYFAELFAQSLGLHLVCFETEDEYDKFLQAVNGSGFSASLGLAKGSLTWVNGEPVGDWLQVNGGTGMYAVISHYNNVTLSYEDNGSCIIEVPKTTEFENINANSLKESYSAFINSIPTLFSGNAILNNLNNTDINSWTRLQATTGNKTFKVDNNWWGTTNIDIINRMIVDFDYNGSLNDFDPSPVLTVPPEDVWPFVSDAYLLNKDGERTYTVGNEEVTFVVEFNRDMDVDYGLRVRFGAAEPYAEYEVSGAFVTPRRWEGTYTLKTTIENGTQYFRIEDGRAADDHWMELYEEPGRFAFEIDTTAAMSMMMQGNATDTGVELTWMQDDYDTLAGYNVYRSDREDGLYTKLNSTVIPVGEEHFFDGTIEPAKVYYYNFTVVLSDMTETPPSGKIVIMSKDTMAPNVYHTPVRTAYTGSNLIISATVTDNLGVRGVKLYYRAAGASSWYQTQMNPVNDKYYGTIPADRLSAGGMEYYIEAYDGVSYTYNGTSDAPYSVMVRQAVDASSKGDVDGDGVITNKDALMILQAINDLINLTEEQFLRADLNGDGELSSAEALRILKYVSGKVTTIID